MKVKELIEKLQEFNPEHDVVWWDTVDNWTVNYLEEDEVNKSEVILCY